MSSATQVRNFTVAALTALAVSGCGKAFHQINLNSSSSANSKVDLTQSAYQSSVYSYVKSVGCAQCHANGPTTPNDWFAGPSLDAAFQSALPLVDQTNPSSSLFAKRVADGHCGFPAICGVDNAPMLASIQKWISQSAVEQNSGGAKSCTFNGQVLASGAAIVGYSAATVPFAQTCDSVKVSVSCSNGILSPASAFASCAVQTGATCAFNGQTLASGDSAAAYQAATVSFGSVCMKEMRTCTNGTLSGSFSFMSCAVNPPANCSFNGTTVLSGATAQGYPSAVVPYNQTCTAQPITCTNGILNPPNDVGSCSVLPGASCSFNGQTLASGGMVKAYQTATVPAGQTCVSMMRTCTDGTLSGTYAYAACSVGVAATCTFNGQTIQDGATVQGYASATVPFGQKCTPQTITCSNGLLSPTNLVGTCSVLPGASCTFNGQTLADTGIVSAYQSATVPFGSQCVSQMRTCTNGTLSGTYTNSNCAVDPAATCKFNGQTIANLGTAQGYPSATVPFGQTCQSNTITCNNGVLSPANQSATCSVLPGAACSFNGQTVASGQAVTGYASATVPAGATCSQISVSCANGALSPATASPTCSVSSVVAGSVFVPANQAVLLRLNVGLNMPGKKTFTCQKGVNCSSIWNSSGQYNVNFKADPNQSGGANQVSLLAFAGCNDINPSDWAVNTSGTLTAQTTNLINAGIQMVDNHTGGLGSNSAFKPQVTAAFQTLISDPAFASANVKTVFVAICTAAQTFGVGMKGF